MSADEVAQLVAEVMEEDAVEEEGPGRSGNRKIRPINKAVANRICAGQVITSLASAVKELIENSLDASAKAIEINLVESGIERIEVSDNGVGIGEVDFEALCQKYSTSKINNFDDLTTVKSFGFRGEALNSLCTLCSEVIVHTKTKESQVGSHLEYDKLGDTLKKTFKARTTGTTVVLKKIFSTYPVRQMHVEKQLKKELGGIIDTLQAYALALPDLKMICYNTIKGKRKEILNLPGQNTLALKVRQVFKPLPANVEFAQSDVMDAVAEEFDVDTNSESYDDYCKSITVTGFISQTGSGSKLSDKQYFAVNKRPVVMIKLAKIINQVFRSYDNGGGTYPFFCLHISIPCDKVDVNVTPDKRTILIANEGILYAIVKSSLIKMFGENAFSLQKARYDQSSSQMTIIFEKNKNHTSTSLDADDSETNNIISSGSKRPLELDDDDEGQNMERRKITDYFGVTSRTSTSPVSNNTNNTMHFNFAPDDLPESQPVDQPPEEMEINVAPMTPPTQSDYSFNIHTPSLVNEHFPSSTPVLSPDATNVRRGQQSGDFDMPVQDDSTDAFDAQMFRGVEARRSESPHEQYYHITEISSARKRTSNCSATSTTPTGRPPKDFVSARTLLRKSAQSATLCSDNSGSETESRHPSYRSTPNTRNSRNHNRTPLVGVSNIVYDSSTNADEDVVRHSAVDSENDAESVGYSLDGDDEKPVRRRVPFQVNMEAIRKGFAELRSEASASETLLSSSKFEARLDPTDDGKAEDELKRQLDKSSFRDMKLIGQFNKSFILAELGDDVFVVDQHASDERYNYDDLLANSVLDSQQLVSPTQLCLSSYNESLLQDNMKLFNENGFKFTQDDTKDSGTRFMMTAIPLSKDVTFGIDEVEEILEILSHSQTTPQNCRPTRVRDMLASRACRKSIMINDVLNPDQMRRLLDNMSATTYPYTCAHGRPTVRHLMSGKPSGDVIDHSD